MMLQRGLDGRGIDYAARNIWTDDEAAAFVRSVAGGNETVPTVVVGGTAMVNPTIDQVLEALPAD
jgi:glutaredoxin